MAVTFDAGSSRAASSLSVSSCSWTHAASTTNTYLVIDVVGHTSAAGASGDSYQATVNTSAATKLATYLGGTGSTGQCRHTIFGFQLSASGNAAIACSGWSSAGPVTGMAMSFAGTSGHISSAAAVGDASGTWQLGLVGAQSSQMIAGFLSKGALGVSTGTNVTQPSSVATALTGAQGNVLSLYSSGGSSLTIVSASAAAAGWTMIGVLLSTLAGAVTSSGGMVSWWY